jgi:DNA mismatch repair protein MSH2
MASRPDLKVDDEVGFIKFFRGLPSSGNDTIRVFDRGDFYTAHGDNANSIAQKVSYCLSSYN